MLTERRAISISGISTSSDVAGAGVAKPVCSKSPRVISVGCAAYLTAAVLAAPNVPVAKKLISDLSAFSEV